MLSRFLFNYFQYNFFESIICNFYYHLHFMLYFYHIIIMPGVMNRINI